MILAIVASLALSVPTPDTFAEPSTPTHAIELTLDPQGRAQGIAVLEARLVAFPEDRADRLALARALSWSNQHDQALTHYDRLLHGANEQDREALALERLQVLAWKGRHGKAIRGYRARLRRAPADVDARLGLARALRWSGRPLAARWQARQSLVRARERDDVREELAWSYAQVGQRAATGRVLQDIVPSRELRRHLSGLARPRLGTALTGSGNSFGIYRAAPRVRARIPLPGDVMLEAAAGATYLQQGATRQTYGVAGLAAGLAIDRVELAAGAGLYLGPYYRTLDAHARATIHVVDQLHLSFGFRRRPLLEAALPGSIDESGFHGAGVGGAQILKDALPRNVHQLGGTLNVLPGRWGYLYGDAHYLWLSDKNRGFTLSSGLGVDVLGFGRPLPVGLLARWDTYMVGYDTTRTAYFAPKFLDVHSVGPELRVRVWKVELGAAAGRTFPLIATGAKGWFAGGAFGLRTRRLTTALRGEYRADAYYEQWRMWLALDLAL